MRKSLISIASVMVMMVAPVMAENWHTSWKDAAAESKKTGKPILADFTGSDWCGWCIKLHKEVFDTPEFKSWADKHVVLLELDFPQKKQLPADLKKQNDELAKKYNIEGYPTVLFLKADGTEVGRSGYVKGGPSAWIKAADSELK